MSKGLGRGLGALLGDAALQPETDSRLLFLPLAHIVPRLAQPRKQFDPLALEELRASIAEHGVLQPIVVRCLSHNAYEIIAGERRWRAAQLAGLSEIPVRVIEADERAVMEIALIENLQREDLSPMEEAWAYRALMETFSLTQEDAAKRLGISRPTLANTLRLLSLAPSVQDLLATGQMSAGHARALLGLSPAMQEELAGQIVAQTWTVRETEMAVKKALETPEDSPSPEKRPAPAFSRLQESLSQSLGRRVKISQGKRKGKIELEYHGEDDLQALLHSLTQAKEH